MKNLKKLLIISSGLLLAYQYSIYQREKTKNLSKLRSDSQVTKLDTGNIEYAIEGQKGIPLLCIHGGGGYEQGLIMGRLLNDKQQYQIIAPSRAGARQSDLSTGSSFKIQAQSYNLLLDHFNIDKAVVVGLSGGGLSSLQFALDYPERCKALILISAVSPLSAQLHVPDVALKVLNMVMSSDFLSWFLQKLSLNILYAVDGTKKSDFTEESMMHELIWNFFPSSDWRDNVMTEMNQLYTIKDFPFEQVSVPTLLLHGEADRIVATKVSQNTADRIPNAKLVIIPKASHLMIGSDTTLLHQHIDAFLNS